MIVFIKFGGSVITNKRGKETADLTMIGRLARELADAWQAQPEMRLIIGHGSGSFGHVYAARYGIHRGLNDQNDWMGFALTSRAVRRLHGIIIDALLASNIPALSLQPLSSLRSEAGEPVWWHIDSIQQALEHRLVPVIHGDVAFDSAQGSATISTEALFAYLAQQTPLQPRRIILVGETAVYTADPNTQPDAALIPLITQANITEVLNQAGDSHGVDVTGGMYSKVALMWQLINDVPELEVSIIDARPGLLTGALRGDTNAEGTWLRRNREK